MNLSRYWLPAILLLGLAGCRDDSPPPAEEGKSAAELIESGNKLLAENRLEEAMAEFNRALDVQPDSARARERCAAACLQRKKFDQAVYYSTEALKIDGKLASAFFTRGLAEKGLGESEKALEDFTKAVDNGLEQIELLIARGALRQSLARAAANPDEAAKIREKALKDFDRAVKLDPHRASLRLQRAAIHLDRGDYESAVADCDAALNADPNLAAARVARARGECELSEFERAIADCDAAIHLDENLIEAYVIRAKARMEQSSEMRTLAEVAQCRQAADDCRTAIALAKKPKDDAESSLHARTMRGMAHELRGLIYQNLLAAKKAMAEFERALSLDPYLVSTLLRRAVARAISDDHPGALNDCNTAVGIDHTRPDAYSARGLVYALNLEFPKALEDFTQAVSLDRKCAKAYAGRAVVYSLMASAELEKAQRLAAARKTIDPKVQNEIDACLQKSQSLRQKCIDDATQAIAANRHMAKAYLTRALVYARQQVMDKARDDFDAAIREDPRMVKARYNRGVLHYDLGVTHHNRGLLLSNQDQLDAANKEFEQENLELNAAIKDFEESVALDPDKPLYDKCLGQCYQLKNDVIMVNKYFKSMQDKNARIRQGMEESVENRTDFVFKPKKLPDLQPDSDMEPIDKAKIELEKELDATAEK